MSKISKTLRILFSPFHKLGKKLYPETEQQLSQLSERVDRLQEQIENNSFLQQQVDRIEALISNNETLSENVQNINAMLDGYDKVIINIQNLNSEMARLVTEYDRLSFVLNRIRKAKADCGADANATTVDTKNNSDVEAAGSADRSGESYSAIDYFDFENYFRGSRELIKKRQNEYLPYFSKCRNVLDIGCGRGEFLEIMRDNGIHATGVDFYEPFVDYCTEKGLNAVCMDGIAYLSSQNGFDGIFAGQVIEHLTVSQIVNLIDTAYTKLPEGGVLIMETPNPQSLSIYVNAFYLDPSHIKPVHPETMRYLLKNTGFSNVDIIYTEASRPDITIPPIKGEDEFNHVMCKIQNMLFGSQDYAVVARK